MDEITVTEPTTSSSKDKLGDDSPSMTSSVPRLRKNPVSESKKKPQTRRATEVFGIGPAICADDSTITGIRLPTCLQVLRCMMFHCNAAAHSERPGSLGALSRFTTAKVVLKQVTALYEKANIPMVTDRRACEKIVKLLDDNNKLRSIDKSRRDTPATQRKLEEMQAMLSSTFQLWSQNVESLVKNEEDLAFLTSMKGDRAASFGAFDKTLAQKIARRNCRNASALQRLKRSRDEIETSTMTMSSAVVSLVTDDSDTDESSKATSGDDMESEVQAGPRDTIPPQRRKPAGTEAFIPSDLLSRPRLVSLATRLKMTPAQQAAFTQGVITESGGDVSMVATSYATADRSRCKIVGEIAKQIHDNWEPPKLCTLHWDGKMTPTLQNPRVTEERLTVIVGDVKQMKLLGVPSYFKGVDQSCEEIIAELTMKLMNKWNCSERIAHR